MNSTKNNKNKASELAILIILAICAFASVAIVGFIVLFLFYTAVPTVAEIGFFDFIFGSVWDPKGTEVTYLCNYLMPDGSPIDFSNGWDSWSFCHECCGEEVPVIINETPLFGIRNLILTSFVGTFGAILIGVPIGILAAIALAEILPKKVALVVSPAVNLLAGIPSVVYGAVGVAIIEPWIRETFGLATGMTLLAAILVLSVMVLPTIISVSSTSIRAVPKTYMEASLALGLTKEASIYKIIVPAARSGILTGVLLGLGRAIGEAMAIILIAGNLANAPKLLEGARFLTTGIVAEFPYSDGFHRDVLFSIGAVLFVFILIINSLFYAVIKRMEKNNG
jgi:phosphate transport system permease protein